MFTTTFLLQAMIASVVVVAQSQSGNSSTTVNSVSTTTTPISVSTTTTPFNSVTTPVIPRNNSSTPVNPDVPTTSNPVIPGVTPGPDAGGLYPNSTFTGGPAHSIQYSTSVTVIGGVTTSIV